MTTEQNTHGAVVLISVREIHYNIAITRYGRFVRPALELETDRSYHKNDELDAL